jgi:hypothetical protein
VSRLLGIAGLYIAMFVAWTAAGLLMIMAPVWFGNLIHDSFGLYPQVGRTDWGKKLILRIVGLGLLAFAARFAMRIAAL